MSETTAEAMALGARQPGRHPLAHLAHPGTVRLRCAAVLRSVEDGVSPHFKLNRLALPALAERVAAVTQRRFPDLRIPYHSRWRHFEAGGVDRKAELDARIAHLSSDEQARVRIDLTVISVLLDAGAGAQWRYTEHQPLPAAAMPQAAPDELLAMLDRAASAPRATAPADPAQLPPPAADGSPAPAAAAPEAPAPATGGPPTVYTRSEGLGVATFRAFMAGAFSSRAGEPWRADATTLRHVDAAALRAVFQSSASNPLVGLEGRAQLLARLGGALQLQAGREGGEARPGLLWDRLSQGGLRREVRAAEVLAEVLRLLVTVWPGGSRVQGLPAGDVWPHRWAGQRVVGADGQPTTDPTTGGWVPFHKLSQWLTYSLLEPLQWAGLQVTHLDDLTALPEYRNGGLLLDGAVLMPRDPRFFGRVWKPSDEPIIEWRACTVALLDEVAVGVRELLGRDAAQLPLACVLEGGTWVAGRELAAELREGGAPPVRLDSDGTVF